MKTEDFLRDNPDYKDLISRIVEYEEENAPEDRRMLEGKDADVGWSYDDVSGHPSRLFQVNTAGIIDKIFDSNSSTVYCLSDREGTKEALKEFERVQKQGYDEVNHDFPSEDDLPDDLFDDVIGYEDVKWLMRRALTTDDIVNVLLVGPPGSAKTVFLMCIQELESSMFVSAKSTSGPGVLDTMFENTPKYMAVDEFDDMDRDVQEVMSQHMDTGILDETKVGKNRKLKINTNTFASANTTDSIIDQVEDRFLDLHFDEYTREEFEEICEHILPRKENATEEESRRIANAVWGIDETGNVRKAIAVARLSRGDPDKVIGVLDEYSGAPI